MDEFKKVALEAVKKAEERILFHLEKGFSVEQKENSSPVTLADKEAEEIIVSTLKKNFPSHGFVGEEFGNEKENAEFVWYIDPIDGTREFVHKIPTFGTILGLKHGEEIVLGVVNLPGLKETIFASKEEETKINGKSVRVSDVGNLKDSYVSIGGYSVLENQSYVDFLIKLRNSVQSVKGFPYTYAFRLLITGQAEALIDPVALPWDISAWTIIVKQAGGKFSDFYGNEKSLGPTSLATNGKIHDQLLNISREVKI